MSRRTLFLLTALSVAHHARAASAAQVTATPPPELFSPLVTQKFLATAQTQQNPPEYPQYTTHTGVWDYFVPDTWTSGFFPVALYALRDRATLCPSSGLNATDWVTLAQTWSAAEIPLETKTGVGHDVGFLSFPFVQELAM